MPKIRRNLLIITMFVLQTALFGQLQTRKYPVRLSQYYMSYSLVNPAASCATNTLEACVGDKNLLGNFSAVSTYYANAAVRLGNTGNKRNSSFSSAGIVFFNEREGKYLNRSRAYASYAWHGNILMNLQISGGFQLGAMNYLVKGTPLSGDGSDIAPDGNIGVWFYNNWFHAGAMYCQVFNSKIQPLNEIAELSPYTGFDGSCRLNISADFYALPSFSFRIPVKDSYLLADYTFVIGYRKIFSAAVGIHDNNKMISSVEIKNLLGETNPLNLCFTYGFPLKPQDISTNFIEFGLLFFR